MVETCVGFNWNEGQGACYFLSSTTEECGESNGNIDLWTFGVRPTTSPTSAPTAAPTTTNPTTNSPTTNSPTTDSPTTNSPTSAAPSSSSPITASPTSSAPTQSPTTAAPTSQHCSNGVTDQDETDFNCGGGSCPACEEGQRCVTPADCAQGLCEGDVCATAVPTASPTAATVAPTAAPTAAPMAQGTRSPTTAPSDPPLGPETTTPSTSSDETCNKNKCRQMVDYCTWVGNKRKGRKCVATCDRNNKKKCQRMDYCTWGGSKRKGRKCVATTDTITGAPTTAEFGATAPSAATLETLAPTSDPAPAITTAPATDAPAESPPTSAPTATIAEAVEVSGTLSFTGCAAKYLLSATAGESAIAVVAVVQALAKVFGVPADQIEITVRPSASRLLRRELDDDAAATGGAVVEFVVTSEVLVEEDVEKLVADAKASFRGGGIRSCNRYSSIFAVNTMLTLEIDELLPRAS